MFGVVDDFQKELLTKTSDYAINPMFSGAGTNLKILEYFAAGLPVITTEFGTRGLDNTKVDIYLIEERATKIDPKEVEKIDTYKNRKYVEKNFDWRLIAEKYRQLIQFQ